MLGGWIDRQTKKEKRLTDRRLKEPFVPVVDLRLRCCAQCSSVSGSTPQFGRGRGPRPDTEPKNKHSTHSTHSSHSTKTYYN